MDGSRLHLITERRVVTVVRRALARGHGGRILTPNVDIVRQARVCPEVQSFLDDATLVVADGMPLVWASRLTGTPLPERVAGSSLIWSLSAGLATDRRSVFVLGGDSPAIAEQAADRLTAQCPGLAVAGHLSPPFGFDADPLAVDAAVETVRTAAPDVVFVGIGFPRQERLITRLRAALPNAWFLGCGMAVNFVAGQQHRAPVWMQRAGLEWAHRLKCEPRRLARRYLRHDAPYALRLLAATAVRR
ncbi:WecB/TagA/CpsF family glycosyltransferase [Asanoa sp. WMMD1127]|uniref:WecB/TagA/CpsF family glycosyltransferase n=1 Tax=Asanoa sp. WMMD1127 TaxID=3016107 RepID=UPI002415BBC8|nr:WecB/TagA/CpsF family glycosyltransferase [Asanoa sp. WMMD1127]MDG4821055.1 WecB/TagA/CpsF family glycosyltransferase [Asanoa sp. WMMD1127]